MLPLTVVYSQVGINTESPKATLEVASSPNDASVIDGVIPPRLTGQQLKLKDALYELNQTGAIVYVTSALEVTSRTPKTINITEIGYYYFDGDVWVSLKGSNSVDDLIIQNGVSVISNSLGFQRTNNNTTFLGGDLGSGIRQVKWDDIRTKSSFMEFNPQTNKFIALKDGFFEFSINLTVKGPFNGEARIGISKPYAGTLSGASNNSFAFFNQPTISVSSTQPITLYSSGVIYLTAGEEVTTLTRYINPSTNNLNVESINYDRTLTSSIIVKYFADN